MIAITRAVSPSLGACELTHLERLPIDVERATRQHAAYERVLRDAEVQVAQQPALPEHPDAVFVEDTAIVLDELAVITRPGVESRRGETTHMAPVLAAYRTLVHIEAPGTLEGGDVLRLGKRLFVGQTLRSNQHGIRQLAAMLRPHGYAVQALPVHGALHLKSACSALDSETVLANPDWIDTSVLRAARILCVAPDEPGAANVLALNGRIVVSAAFPATRALLDRVGYATTVVDVSELHKAEAGLTCMSLLIDGSTV